MTLPTIIFGLVVAMLYGALYHFIRGGGGWRLLLFFGLSILGFLMLGSLNLGMGSVGSLLVLVAGEWLSRIDVKKESGV